MNAYEVMAGMVFLQCKNYVTASPMRVQAIMPMTHVPETGTENPYQKTCTSFLQVCHANRYRFFQVLKSGTE